MMFNRKGQMTIFAFIGLIILFSLVAIYFFQSQQTAVQRTPQITEEISSELQPIKAFVESCAYDKAKEAILLIGTHGGYIGLEPQYFQYTKTGFNLEPSAVDPTNYDALTVSPGWEIPYWWHLSSDNKCSSDCQFSTERPALYKDSGYQNAVELQIDRYVNANMPECLDGFRSFAEKDIQVTNTSGIKTTTTIAKNDVQVFVEYPLEVKWQGGKQTVSQFETTLDVSLSKMFELATALLNKNRQGHYLELHTLNLISAYSGMDESKLPPPAGTELRIGSRTWTTSETKQRLSNILTTYVNAMQVTHTSNYQTRFFPDDPMRTGLYAFMTMPLDDFYYNYDVNLNYMGWPMYLYITKGELIRARDSLGIPLLSALVPIQRYDFPYDASYPVMFHLRDNNAFKGAGYDFFFAYEVNIRNNAVMEVSGSGLTSLTDIEDRVPLCNEINRDSGVVTFKVKDAAGNPVENAQVTYVVGDISCIIGTTVMEGDSAVFRGKFPTGAVGSLVVDHPDYEKHVENFFIAPTNDKTLPTIRLDGYAYKNVTAQVISMSKGASWSGNFIVTHSWQLNPYKRSLQNKEHAVVVLERILDSPDQEDVIAAADIYPGQSPQIRLLPGNYTMQVTYIKDNTTIVIPKEEICDDSFFGLGEDDCKDVGPTPITQNGPVSTQYQLNVKFTNELYANNKNIEFTAYNFNLEDADGSLVHKDMERWSNAQNQVNQVKDLFMPVYVNAPASP